MAVTGVLWRGGRVLSPAHAGATALVVDDGRIAWIGADRDDAPPAHRTVIELGGMLVTPAFVDAHVHATSTGLALDGLDLAAAPSLTAALDLVERHARARRGDIVLGTGWDETRWPEQRPPTQRELDRASYGGVVYLARADVHSAVASSALLAAVPGARALAGWADDGLVRLDAHHAIRQAAHTCLQRGQRRTAQRRARRRAAELGIGCVHEMAGPEVSGADDLAELIELAATEPGPDVIGYWGALGDIETPRRLGIRAAGGDLFCDGAFGSHTAALSAPYADDPSTSGSLRYDADAIGDHVTACVEAGLQAGFHVIGDRAIGTVLDGFAAAVDRVGLPRVVAGRHRLEHAELLDDAAIARMARYGLVASVQPAFEARWGGPDRMYARRLGEERMRMTNPYAALAAAGVPLAFGSDAPVTPLGPWAGVRAAVDHPTAAHRLPATAAFAAATAGGWHAAGVDGGGVLRPGAPATFAVWDAGSAAGTGPGLLPDLGRPDPVCVRTVVRGVSVYDREGAAS